MDGEDMRGQMGIPAQVFKAIKHVNVRMISHGGGEIHISFMTEEDARSLRAAFFQTPDGAVSDIESRLSAAPPKV